MDIQTTRVELAKLLLSESREAVLEKIGKLLKSNEADWWDEISDGEKQAIEEGIAELDRGEGIPHEQVMKGLDQKYAL